MTYGLSIKFHVVSSAILSVTEVKAKTFGVKENTATKTKKENKIQKILFFNISLSIPVSQ